MRRGGRCSAHARPRRQVITRRLHASRVTPRPPYPQHFIQPTSPAPLVPTDHTSTGSRTGECGWRDGVDSGGGCCTHLHKSVGGGMDDLQQLHDRGAVVGDGHLTVVVVDQLVHAARAEGSAHDVHHGLARVDVADQLPLALRCVRPFLEQNDLRLHHRVRSHLHLRGTSGRGGSR